VQAPPRGVHHHFCRLALVSFPGTPTDCRTFWPPDFGASCFVCGPTGFVEAAADILVALGHEPRRIRTERFGGTS